MALSREKIEYGEIRKFGAKKSEQRYRVFLKKCMNRWVRRKAKKIDLEGNDVTPQKEYKGWEF